jgi:hypothetical protein
MGREGEDGEEEKERDAKGSRRRTGRERALSRRMQSIAVPETFFFEIMGVLSRCTRT